jgi:hypothetical protein
MSKASRLGNERGCKTCTKDEACKGLEELAMSHPIGSGHDGENGSDPSISDSPDNRP